MHTLSPTLRTYIEAHIIPLYDTFDPAHQRNHVLSVIDRSMALAAHYDVNPDMVYTIAAYHDTGLSRDRQTHHLVSGHILRSDHALQQWFDAEQIEVMAEAVEDHRASNAHEPRSIYGKIVAEADRLIDPYTILSRALLFGLSHHPELNEQAQIARATHHLIEKYGDNGYLKLWIPESPNRQRLQEVRSLLNTPAQLRQTLQQIYAELTAASSTPQPSTCETSN